MCRGRKVASTRFCAVNGTLDPFVPRRAVEKMFRGIVQWSNVVGVQCGVPSGPRKMVVTWWLNGFLFRKNDADIWLND